MQASVHAARLQIDEGFECSPAELIELLLMGARGLLSRAKALSEGSAGNSADTGALLASALTDLRHLLRQVANYEKSRLFPELRALTEKTFVSHCRAGITHAHVRWVLQQQFSLEDLCLRVRDAARQRLSPHGPCESCHQLLLDLDEFERAMFTHFRHEQELFTWAMAREDELTRSRF